MPLHVLQEGYQITKKLLKSKWRFTSGDSEGRVLAVLGNKYFGPEKVENIYSDLYLLENEFCDNSLDTTVTWK